MGKQRLSDLLKLPGRLQFRSVLFPEYQTTSIDHLGWDGYRGDHSLDVG